MRAWLVVAAVGLALAGCGIQATSPTPTASAVASVTPTSTASTQTPVARVVFASDGHWGMAGTDYQRYYADFVHAVTALNAQIRVDRVIFNGDLGNEKYRHLAEVRQALAGLPVPYLVTRGNNDVATAKQWQELWGTPLDQAIVLNGLLFVLADTSDGKGSQECPDARWVSDALAANPDAPNVFLVFHVPPFDRTTLKARCTRLQQILADQSRVRAVFNGHVHALDQVVSVNHVPFLFDGHVGSNYGVGYRGFRVAEFFADGTLHTWTTADGIGRFGETTLAPRR